MVGIYSCPKGVLNHCSVEFPGKRTGVLRKIKAQERMVVAARDILDLELVEVG